ncbi:right-handed parallel beta-helix repeat-containing protein [Candidatus Woesearchaeota archaeon]|nr:right-handed parallel beta-helix repeat-containing protein [Candidatus Woesearchaeota archaeon]
MSKKRVKHIIEFWPYAAALLAIILAVAFPSQILSPSITGFVVASPSRSFKDNLDLSFSGLEAKSSSQYNWFPEHNGLLKSLKLNGKLFGNGSASVWLISGNRRFLIGNFSGSKEDNKHPGGEKSILGEEKSIIGEGKNIIEGEKSILGEEKSNLGGEKSIFGGRTFDEAASRGNNSLANLGWDARIIGGGKADNSGIAKLNFISEYARALPEKNLCTIWSINSLEDICFGDESCCSFLNLASEGRWNDSLFLTLGRYGAGRDNVISAKGISYDVDLDAARANISISPEAFAAVSFEEGFREISAACEETCELPSLNSSLYLIAVEAEGSAIAIGSLAYSVEQEIMIRNNPPALLKNIEDLRIESGGAKAISLAAYFTGGSGNSTDLFFKPYRMRNIRAIIRGDTATFIPEENFTGTESTFITANDSYLSAASNIFSITVFEAKSRPSLNITEKVEKPKVKVGQPVRWVKVINASQRVANLSSSIENNAMNITIKDLETQRIISPADAKVSDGKSLDNIGDFNLKQQLKAIGKEESLLNTIKREHITEDPTNVSFVSQINEQLLILVNEKNQITGYFAAKQPSPKGLLTRIMEWLSGSEITGFAVSEQNRQDRQDKDAGQDKDNNQSIQLQSNTTLYIEAPVSQVMVEYYTEPPVALEQEISGEKKIITISSETHYEDILAFSELPREISSANIELFWLVKGTKEKISFEPFDTNNNGLADYIEWIVPSLSNQTYELSLSIINVQSYPPLGGNWTVRFNVTGAANLTIRASNGTTYPEFFDDNISTTQDIMPIELRCNDTMLWSRDAGFADSSMVFVLGNGTELSFEESLGSSRNGNGEGANYSRHNLTRIKAVNFSCNSTAYHTIVELTTGKHTQSFTFGDLEEYAYNDVGPDCTAPTYTDGTGRACANTGTCTGTPHDCSSYPWQQSACEAAGCTYSPGDGVCSGTHNACSTYTDSASCSTHGTCTWTPGSDNTCVDSDADNTMESTDDCHLSTECSSHLGSSCSYWNTFSEITGVCADDGTGSAYTCTTAAVASGEHGTGISGGSASNFHSGNENSSCTNGDELEICSSTGGVNPSADGVCLDASCASGPASVASFNCGDTVCSKSEINSATVQAGCSSAAWACASSPAGTGWSQDGICVSSGTCVTSGHVCYKPSWSMYLSSGCDNGANCLDGDPCDATLTDGSFDSAYGTCSGTSCIAAAGAANTSTSFNLSKASPTNLYTIKGSYDTTGVYNSSNYSVNQTLNFSHATWGLRLQIISNFSTGPIDLSNLTIDANNYSTAVNWTFVDQAAIPKNHTLFVPNTLGLGVYACGTANSTREVFPQCPNRTVWTNSELVSGQVLRNGLVAEIVASKYVVSNLSGSGIGQGVAQCGFLSQENTTYSLLQNVSSSGTCFTITASNVTLDCLGNNITYGITGTGAGVNTSSSGWLMNLTIKNCRIAKSGQLGSSNYGISLEMAVNGSITNNTILPHGLNLSYGISLSNSSSFLIARNNISTNGYVSNLGIELRNSSVNNMITENTIMTNGSNFSYGIMLAWNSSNNTILSNNITASGLAETSAVGTTNLGIYLQRNSSYNEIINNTIKTNGTSQNYGIYLFGNTTSNIIRNNTIMTNGTNTNYGIRLTQDVVKTTIVSNNINAGGKGTGNYGIYILTRSDFSLVINNTISANGNDSSYGVYLQNSRNNNITLNWIRANGGNDSNFGMRMIQNSSFNDITENIIIANGTSSNSGIRLESGSSNNTLRGNNITTGGTTSHAVFLDSAPPQYPVNNTFRNNTLKVNMTGQDILFNDAFINYTFLVDQPISNYTMTANGSIVIIRNTKFGEIYYLEPVNASGSNLSNDVRIGNNSFIVNENISSKGWNRTANISFFNADSFGFGNPFIARNGIACNLTTDPQCFNFTSLKASIVTFNVTSFSNYSLINLNNGPSTPVIIYPVNALNYTNVGYLNFSTADPDNDAVTYRVYINATINISTGANVTSWNASDGFYNMTVSADDGLLSSANATYIFFRMDSTPPGFSNNQTNATSPRRLANISFNMTITDNMELSFFLFSWNGSGRWENLSNGSMASSGNSQFLMVNKSPTAQSGSFIAYRWYANDSLGNINASEERNFTLADSAPAPAAPVFNNTAPFDNQDIIANSTYSDQEGDSGTVNFTWYADNVPVYNQSFSNVLNGTVLTSNLSSWNFTGGQLVNLSVIANSTSFTSPAVNSPTITVQSGNATMSCGILNRSNQKYVLINNVSASRTCFTIGADNITLDCAGNYIQYGITGSGAGINLTPTRANVTIKSCNLTKIGVAGTDNIGISLNSANYTLIANNTISTKGGTTGSSSNYGIYIDSSSNNNNLSNNTIRTNGTGDDDGINIGGKYNAVLNNSVYSFSNGSGQNAIGMTDDFNIIDGNLLVVNSTTQSIAAITVALSTNAVIRSNTIIAETYSGTPSNTGIFLNGYNGVTGYFIWNNTIRALSPGSDNYGIELSQGVTATNISNNTIITNGTSANYGIFLDKLSGSSAPNTNIIIANNTISTAGSSSDNYGIYALHRANTNLIKSNRISTWGTDSNYGIFFFGNITNNNITENTVITNGTSFGNYGIYLSDNSSGNRILSNVISTNGNRTGYGIYLLDNSTGNTLMSNLISTMGGNDSNFGIRIERINNGTPTSVSYNQISTNGTSSNYGLYLLDSKSLNISGNIITTNGSSGTNQFGFFISQEAYNFTIRNNSITTNGSVGDAFRIDAAAPDHPANITLINNTLVNIGGRDLRFSDVGINYTYLIDQPIEDYLFTSQGGIISVKNSEFGQIDFLKPVNGSGTNLSGSISIANNSITVNENSSAGGFNRSANISLFNIGNRGFAQPSIGRNGVLCDLTSDPQCFNFTTLTASTVIFNVTSFSNYSIINIDATAPALTVISPQKANYSVRHIYFNVSIDETGLGCAYSLDSAENASMNTSNSTYFVSANATTTPGLHNITFYCNDSVNNVGTAAAFNFKVAINETCSSGSGCNTSNGLDICADTNWDDAVDKCELETRDCAAYKGRPCSLANGTLGLCTNNSRCEDDTIVYQAFGTGLSGGQVQDAVEGNNTAGCSAGTEGWLCNSSTSGGYAPKPTGICVEDACRENALVALNCIDRLCSVSDVSDNAMAASCTAGWACDASVNGSGFSQKGLCNSAGTCTTTGHVCNSSSGTLAANGCGTSCNDDDACDTTILDGQFDSAFGTCSGYSCTTSGHNEFVGSEESGTTGYSIKGTSNLSIGNNSDFLDVQILNFSHATLGLRLQLVANFSKGDVDVRNLTLQGDAMKTAINKSKGLKNVLQNHTLFLPNTLSQGFYVCPFANSTDEVYPHCPGLIAFSNADASAGTWKSGIYGFTAGNRYGIGNLTGSGSGQSVSTCSDLNVANTTYNLVANVTASQTCFTISANNVTLDCNNNIISYAQMGSGSGVSIGNVNFSQVRNCTIVQDTQFFAFTSSFGINLSGANNASIFNNSITTRSTDSYGVYLQTSSKNNIIFGNNITSTGSLAYGIYLITSSNSNIIQNNNITTTSGGSMMGVPAIYAVTTHNQTIRTNNITTLGQESHGIHLKTAARDSNISFNNITAAGAAAYGIYLQSNINNTRAEGNTIRTTGSGSYAVYLSSSTNSLLINNSVNMSGSGAAAFMLYQDSNFNTISFNNITHSAGDGFVLQYDSGNTGSSPRENNFTNNTLSNILGRDLNISYAGTAPGYYPTVNLTQLIDQPIKNYSLGNLVPMASHGGAFIWVKNSEFGEIDFFYPINATGYNLSNDIRIRNNSIFANDTVGANGLNRSANISLFNIGDRGLSSPVILRDEGTCDLTTFPQCFNFTALTADTVTINVTSFSNYSIGAGADTSPPAITIISPAMRNFSLRVIDFNVSLSEPGSACRMMLNSSGSNISMNAVNTSYFNFTNVSVTTGYQNVSFFCNDTSNNFAEAARWFRIAINESCTTGTECSMNFGLDNCIDTDGNNVSNACVNETRDCSSYIGKVCDLSNITAGICTNNSRCENKNLVSGEYGSGLYAGGVHFHSGNETAECSQGTEAMVCDSTGGHLPNGTGACVDNNCMMGTHVLDCSDSTCNFADVTAAKYSSSCSGMAGSACDSTINSAGFIQDGICDAGGTPTCQTSGYLCNSSSIGTVTLNGCGGAACSDGDPCDATLTDGNFDKTYGICSGTSCQPIPPGFSGNQTNASSGLQNGNITFNITITDNIGLSFYMFSWNGTGVWDNATNGSISGTSQFLNINKSSNQSGGKVIGYIWYANDTAGSWNNSGLSTFSVVVGNTPAVTEFVPPTQPNASKTTNTTAHINLSIGDSNFNVAKFSWNGTNDTQVIESSNIFSANFTAPNMAYAAFNNGTNTSVLYNATLLLMLNFENRSVLGENSTLVTDLSLHAKNGSVFGTPTYSRNARYGGSFNFDGTDDYMNISNNKHFQFGSNDFAFSFWFNLTSFSSSVIHPFINSGKCISGGVPSHTAWSIYLSSDTIIFGRYDGTQTNKAVTFTPAINKDYNFFIQRRGNNLQFFVNGTQLGSNQDVTGMSYAPTTSGNQDVYIGYIQTGGSCQNNLYLPGEIDEVRIWNRSFLPEDVWTFYGSNLEKRNTSAWNFYTNQTPPANYSLSARGDGAFSFAKANASGYYLFLNKSSLADGVYNYYGWTMDADSAVNQSDMRQITVDSTPPGFSGNQTNASLVGQNGNATFNITITDNVGLSFYMFSWNGTGVWDNATNGSISGDSVFLNINKTPTIAADKSVSYMWYANNTVGGFNNTALGSFTVFAGNAPPSIQFVPPTQPNATKTTNTTAHINLSIGDSNFNVVKFSWNGTNDTQVIESSNIFSANFTAPNMAYAAFNNGTNTSVLYNATLLLMLNFENRSVLGENSTLITDLSLHAKNGSVFGTPPYSPNARFGGSFNLDGTSDYMNISNNKHFQFGSNDFAFSFWFNLTSFSSSVIHPFINSGKCISGGVPSHTAWSIYLSSDTIIFGRYDGTQTNKAVTFTPAINKDYNFFIQRRGNNLQFFVNGTQLGSNQDVTGMSYAPTTSGNQDVYIGYIQTGGSCENNLYLPGEIDEIRVWNRSFLPEDVSAFYGSNLEKKNTSAWNFYTNQTPPTSYSLQAKGDSGFSFAKANATGYYLFLNKSILAEGVYDYYGWTMDANSAVNQSDMRQITVDSTPPGFSGNQTNASSGTQNGNITFNITISDNIGLSFFMFSWNGTGVWENLTNGSISGASQFLNINKSSSQTGGKVIGYIWYANDTAGNWNNTQLGTFSVVRDVPPGINFTTPTSSGGVYITTPSAIVNVSIHDPNASRIIVDWNGTNETMFYINSTAMNASFNLNNFANFTFKNGSTNFSMYDHTLTLMLNLGNRSALGENSTKMVDVSRYSRNGSCSGSSCPSVNISGKYGKAMSFDGGDYIDGGTSSVYSTIPGITLAAWVKLDTLTGNQVFFWKDTVFQFRWDGNSMNFRVGSGSGWASEADLEGGSLAAGEWAHVAATYDASADVSKIYKNGIQAASGTHTLTGGSNSQIMSMGADALGSRFYLDGEIDEIRVWNRTLAASEIMALHLSDLQKQDPKNWTFSANQSSNENYTFNAIGDGTVTLAKSNLTWNNLYINKSSLADGTYAFQAYASDSDDNYNATEQRTITIDTAAPGFSGNQTNASSGTQNGNITFNITITDNIGLSFFMFSWNGTGVWENLTNGTLSGISQFLNVNKSTNQGTNSNVAYIWYANDSAGNWNNTVIGSFIVLAANTAPAAPAIIFPAQGKNYSSVPYLNFSATDPEGDAITYDVYINGTLNMSTATNVSSWNASSGYYNITVTARDASLSSANSSVVYFRLDTSFPPFSLNQTNASKGRVNGNISFNITINDTGSGLDSFIFSWNGTYGGAWSNETKGSLIGISSQKITANKTTNLTQGKVIMYLWFINDSAGNMNVSEMRNFSVNNTLPAQVTLSNPLANQSLTNRTPFFNWTASTDADNDNITYTLSLYRMSCADKNNECQRSILNITGLNWTNYSITDQLDVDSVYNWTVFVNDSGNYGQDSASLNFSINSVNAISLVVDNATFVTLSLGQEDNTTDNSPAPVRVRNDGNIRLNISVHANQSLWIRKALNTTFYMMAAGNFSTQPESFNWSGSAQSFTNVTNVSKYIIKQLEFNATKNTGEIEISVTTPPDEPDGAKESFLILQSVWY